MLHCFFLELPEGEGGVTSVALYSLDSGYHDVCVSRAKRFSGGAGCTGSADKTNEGALGVAV